MKLIITEEEKKEIINKYLDNTDKNVLIHLKRNFPIFTEKLENFENPFKFILIDGKTKNLNQSKSFLVNKIYNIISDNFPNLDESIIRRTIKYYIDLSKET